MGDIKFIDDSVIIEGWTKLTYPDLQIDYSPRRTSNAGHRRALVHDFQDGLTINWAQDYPGGVTIRGKVSTPNELHASTLIGYHLRCGHHDLHLDNESRRSTDSGYRRALVHDFQDGLTINWAQDYPGGVTIRGKVSTPDELHASTLKGYHLRCGHHDLHLDNESRRSTDSGHRRALVHDFQDGLTINWAQDYPGGVTIRGKVNVPNELHVTHLKGNHLRSSHHDLHLDNPGRRSSTDGLRRALVHNFSDGLTINWAEDYPGGVTIRGDVNIPQTLTLAGENVADLLAAMSAKISELETRIAELEGATP